MKGWNEFTAQKPYPRGRSFFKFYDEREGRSWEYQSFFLAEEFTKKELVRENTINKKALYKGWVEQNLKFWTIDYKNCKLNDISKGTSESFSLSYQLLLVFCGTI